MVSGSLVREIVFAGHWEQTADGFPATPDSHAVYFASTKPAALHLPVPDHQWRDQLFRKTEVKINTNNFVTEQTFITSKDGTQIPGLSYHRPTSNAAQQGMLPLLLYAYSRIQCADYSLVQRKQCTFWQNVGRHLRCWISAGWYGRTNRGDARQKQNVFDDFIGTAESLIAEGIQQQQAGDRGESNGGLLVGW